MPPQHNFATQAVLGYRDRFASIPAGRNAQTPAFADRLGERAN
jgi:hypothetical protein